MIAKSERARLAAALTCTACVVPLHAQWDHPLLGAFLVGTGSGLDYELLELADLNDDGLDDLLVHEEGETVFVRLNLGNAVFGEVLPIVGLSDTFYSMRVADVVGDASPDLIVCDEHIDSGVPGQLRVFEGDGLGHFVTTPILLVGDIAFAVGDIDGDGDNDIVTSDGQFVIIHENESGLFTMTQIAHAPAGSEWGDAAGFELSDIDGDDHLDLIHLRRRVGVSVFKNDGDGAFGPSDDYETLIGIASPIYNTIAVGDWNNDGANDIFVGGDSLSHGLTVLENDGNGVFSPFVPVTNGYIDWARTLDWNADGHAGLLLVTSFDGIGVLMNDGGVWSFPRLGFKGSITKRLMTVGDVDGDGRDDIAIMGKITGSTISGATVWFGLSRSRGWAAPLSVPVEIEGSGADIVLGNFGGDERLDLVRIDSTGIRTRIQQNTGFDPVIESQIDGVGLFYKAADVDADGDDDLIALNSPYDVRFWRCNGDGTFEPPTPLDGSPVNQFFAAIPGNSNVADLDGNGADDFVTVERNDYVHVWLGQPGGMPTHTGAYRLIDGVQVRDLIVTSGYFDADEHLDIACYGESLSRSVVILTGDGAGGFPGRVVSEGLEAPSTVFALVSADVDQDGDDDLFAVGSWGEIALLINNGSGSFTTTWESGRQMRRIIDSVAVDINGDGDPDLVTLGSDDDMLGISLGLPGPAMSEPVPYRYGEYTDTVDFAIGDVTSDGLPDILASASGDNVFLIENPVRALACDADLTGQNVPQGDPRFGWPDGFVTGVDLLFFVNEWINAQPIADVTTQNAPVGDPNYGVPDGLITGIDLQYYVNLWVVGCP